MTETFPEQTLVVKISEKWDNRLDFNGMIYSADKINNPDLSSKTITRIIEEINQFNQIYQNRYVAVSLQTKCTPLVLSGLFVEKYGIPSRGGVMWTFARLTVTPKQARMIVRGLQENPQQFYTIPRIEYLNQHVESD